MHMRPIVLFSLSLSTFAVGQTDQDPWAEFVTWAEQEHGADGKRAAEFLAAYRPERDRAIALAVLRENLTLALQARSEFFWAKRLSDERFYNDVLPYAVLDETREAWRAKLKAIAGPIVADCKTATEAAQALNREFFDAIGVHYNTGRKKPNQSPAESMSQGRATCTGLTILLVDACRSVGVPARAAGVASWHDKRGNHTWAEVWDGEWFFTGADEYDSKGLNRGWFVGDASRAKPGDPRFAVWASSWQPTGHAFPMVWSRADRSVHGVDVTLRYKPKAKVERDGAVVRHVRLWDVAGGKRLVGRVRVLGADGSELATSETRGGRADLNDMATLAFTRENARVLEVSWNGAKRTLDLSGSKPGAQTLDLVWGDLASPGLSRKEAMARIASAAEARLAEVAKVREKQLEKKEIVVGDLMLRILEKTFGEAPEGGHSLWISMHGGGGAPARVNDQQWQNQIRLYRLEEGIYVAPRAPTNTWNLWHQAHIDGLFDALIESYVATRGVDPDRVFLLGYSAGGDGVYQLAPRMADRFAAAAMMAGHPNETSPLGLRNLPFALLMGGKDKAYRRNAIAAEWEGKLGELRKADADGYPHFVRIYPQHGHWMNGDDKEALPWMAKHVRGSWPERVVWMQDDVTHTRFYWLAVAEEDAVARRLIRAEVDGQTIRIESDDAKRVTLRLHDLLVNLDEEITVIANEKTVFEGRVARSADAIDKSIEERLDPRSAAMATLDVSWD